MIRKVTEGVRERGGKEKEEGGREGGRGREGGGREGGRGGRESGRSANERQKTRSRKEATVQYMMHILPSKQRILARGPTISFSPTLPLRCDSPPLGRCYQVTNSNTGGRVGWLAGWLAG